MNRTGIFSFWETFPGTEEVSVAADLQHAVTSCEKPARLSDAAGRTGRTARIHIKVDTGMTQMVFLLTIGAEEVEKDRVTPDYYIEGLFTHFATADERIRRGL